ncbi:MAG: transporter [Rhodanobacter sp.]
MKIRLDTGNDSQGNNAMVARIESVAVRCLERFKRCPTCFDADLSGASGGKGASGKKHRASTAAPRHVQAAGVGFGKKVEDDPVGMLTNRLGRTKQIRAGYRLLSRSRLGVPALLATAMIVVAASASATDTSDPVISTDRPGIPYGTAIVPVGHLQLETGLPTFENDPLAGGHSVLLSEPTYLRYGLSDDLEVQLAASPWNRLSVTQDGQRHSLSGAGDLQLGAKFALSSGGGAMPALTLIGYVTAPTGNRNFSDGRPAYNLNAVASWSLTGNTSFTTMASFTRAPADDDRHANSGTLAASLSHSFTTQLTSYVEAGWFPGYTHTASTALAGAGVTYLVSSHVQVDGFFDVGLNHDSPRSVVGTGVSILF